MGRLEIVLRRAQNSEPVSFVNKLPLQICSNRHSNAATSVFPALRPALFDNHLTINPTSYLTCGKKASIVTVPPVEHPSHDPSLNPPPLPLRFSLPPPPPLAPLRLPRRSPGPLALLPLPLPRARARACCMLVAAPVSPPPSSLRRSRQQQAHETETSGKLREPVESVFDTDERMQERVWQRRSSCMRYIRCFTSQGVATDHRHVSLPLVATLCFHIDEKHVRRRQTSTDREVPCHPPLHERVARMVANSFGFIQSNWFGARPLTTRAYMMRDWTRYTAVAVATLLSMGCSCHSARLSRTPSESTGALDPGHTEKAATSAFSSAY